MNYLKQLSVACLLSGVLHAQEPVSVTLSPESVNAIVAAQMAAQGKCYEGLLSIFFANLNHFIQLEEIQMNSVEELNNLVNLLRETQTTMVTCGISKDFLKQQFVVFHQRVQQKKEQLVEKKQMLTAQGILSEWAIQEQIGKKIDALTGISLILRQISEAL